MAMIVRRCCRMLRPAVSNYMTDFRHLLPCGGSGGPAHVMLAIPLTSTEFSTLRRFRTGKVRDVYDLGDSLLIVATDRISAFDYVMGSGIPDKGRVLTQLSVFWFERTRDVVANHLIATDPDDFPAVARPHAAVLQGGSRLVRKTQPIPVECVARGYLSGSGWKEYKATVEVCGI